MSIQYHIIVCCMKLLQFKAIFGAAFQWMLAKGHDAHNDYLKKLPSAFYRKFKVTKQAYDQFFVYEIDAKNQQPSAIVLFLCGGAGFFSPTPIHLTRIKKICEETGARGYLLLYPLSPEYSVQKACDWAIKWYEQLVAKKNTQKVFLVGDSAGANLAAYLATNTSKKPDGVVMISPATGMQYRHGAQMAAAAKRDAYLSIAMEDIIATHWLREIEMTNPMVDPVSIDYRGFPPAQVFYGTEELFYPFMPDLLQKMKVSDTPLTIVEGKGLCHIWAEMDFFPEGKAARKQMVEFIKKTGRLCAVKSINNGNDFL